MQPRDYTIANTQDMPRLHLRDRQIYDLEMLLVGGFAPLSGFMNEADYTSVVETMRCTDGTLFPIPVVLDVAEDVTHSVGDSVVLCDQFGTPLAVLDIESRYQPDKQREAAQVYGTTDSTHPGVRYLMERTGDVYLGGSVHTLQLPVRHDFRELRYTPAELKAEFQQNGWNQVVAFQTRNPMHRVHFELIKRAHETTGAPVLVHPVVGMTRAGDIDYLTRVRTYQIVCDTYGASFTKLALLPLAMRMAGPREALWHMIIRRNYGATHFIVGRDHAGPGNNSQGEPFYDPYEAQTLAAAHAAEISIEVVLSPELQYSAKRERYVSAEELTDGEATEHISGTEFRRRLLVGESIPEWFSFPETLEVLARGIAKQQRRGVTLFFTGLSGAGKSTIAHIVATRLLELQEREVSVLDGDVVRQHLTSELGFSKAHRDLNVQRVGFVASEIARHGGIAVTSLIAPYAAARRMVREQVAEHSMFIEIYVATSLSVCEARDVKGLYRKARTGRITGLTGIDDPYEVPEHPELTLSADNGKPETQAQVVLDYLKSNGYITY